MKLATFLKTWRGARLENMASRPIMLGLVVTIVVLAFMLLNQQRTIVVVPPSLTTEASISQNQASHQMQQEWGFFFTNVTGNMTPRSAELIKSSVEELLAPNIRNRVMEWIDDEVAVLKRDRVTLSFSPTIVRYETEIDRVVVSGEMVMRGLRGQERRQLRTYELGFVTSNYKVRMNKFDVYEGAYERRAERNAE